MNRGKRYDSEPKLNLKKVFAVVIAIVVVIMIVFILKGILEKGEEKGKITSQSYFVAFKDNKYGVINANGDFVIDPSYQELIVIPSNKNDIFLCTYDVNYQTGEYKTKALNSKNQQIFTNYDKIEAIVNHDESNNLWYEENALKVQKDGKWGLIHYNGKETLKMEYDEIVAIVGIKNAFRIQKDGKYGIADSDGKVVIEPKYSEITNLGTDNKSGYIIKDENGKYGIIDYSNNQILEAKFDGIEKVYGNNEYVVTVGGKQKLVDAEGKDVLTTGFEQIQTILKDKQAGVIFISKGKYGVMKTSGEVTIPANLDELKEAKEGFLIAKKDGKYGVIDLAQTQKIGYEYTSIQYNEKADIYIAEDSNYIAHLMNSNFEEKVSGILMKLEVEKGYIELRVGEENKYYNLKFEEKNITDIYPANTLYLSKKDGKYGFTDKTGKVIVDYQYDDATEQNTSGFAGIKKDGKWGSIDSKGNIMQEPTYLLDDYLLVDFIGRWHLGEDLNMKCYNQL